jgi:hypothetical protein
MDAATKLMLERAKDFKDGKLTEKQREEFLKYDFIEFLKAFDHVKEMEKEIDDYQYEIRELEEQVRNLQRDLDDARFHSDYD